MKHWVVCTAAVQSFLITNSNETDESDGDGGGNGGGDGCTGEREDDGGCGGGGDDGGPGGGIGGGLGFIHVWHHRDPKNHPLARAPQSCDYSKEHKRA